METQPIISKIKTFLKISICSFVCFGVSDVALAEYYLVYSGGNGCGCKRHHVKRHRVRHHVKRYGCRPKRVIRRPRCEDECTANDYYVWQGSPCDCGVGCGGAWSRGGTGCGGGWARSGCGEWIPDAWANDYYYKNSGYDRYDYSYNYDLATADDNPYINPDLQINY